MSQPQPPAASRQRRGDDLTQIHGIGQAMEHKLNRAGIFTFAQLAGTPNEKLAALFSHMPGWSAEREKDLINRARDLMEKEVPPDNLASDDNAQYSAQFSVDLLLDSRNRVHRTHILRVHDAYVQSGMKNEDSWGDWDGNRLVNFICENAMIGSEQGPRKTLEQKLSLEPARKADQQAKTNELPGELNIRDVTIFTNSGAVAHWLVAENEPFKIEFRLDLSKLSLPPGSLLQCQTDVAVKNMTNGKRQNIGEGKGTVTVRDLVPFFVNCRALPQGSYRLEACVTLSSSMEDSNPRSRLMAMTEGRVFRVS